MRFARFQGRLPLPMAPAGDDGDAGGGADGEDVVTLDDKDPPGDPDPDEPKDRGDDVDPKLDPKALAKVADGAEAGDDAAGGKKGSAHVPIGRFNEVNEAKKALERRVAELEKVQPTAPPTPKPTEPPKPVFDEDKAEREYMTHLAEGEFDKAAAIRKDINTHIKAQAREEAVAESDQRQTARQTVQTLTQVAEQAVLDWPYLDTEDGKDTMDLIIAARRGFEAGGMSAPEALKAAVDKIAPKFAPEGTPGKESTGKAPGADTRSQQANARGADASGRQPPRVDGGAGNRATAGKLDVETMSEAQFDALSPQEKSRLRGDA